MTSLTFGYKARMFVIFAGELCFALLPKPVHIVKAAQEKESVTSTDSFI